MRPDTIRVDLAGYTLDVAVTLHPQRPPIRIALDLEGVHVTGVDLMATLHDDAPGFTLAVRELDRLGLDVDAAARVPITLTLDRDDVVTLTVRADDPLTYDGTITGGAAAVGETAVATVTATLPDGTAATGTAAITVIPAGVASIAVTVTENA